MADIAEAKDCLAFICGVSGPLSLLLLVMLRRGYPARPNLTAATAGLAAGAAAATLLNFFHPFDAAATDLVVHAFAVGLVVLANRAIGGRTFARRARNRRCGCSEQVDDGRHGPLRRNLWRRLQCLFVFFPW